MVDARSPCLTWGFTARLSTAKRLLLRSAAYRPDPVGKLSCGDSSHGPGASSTRSMRSGEVRLSFWTPQRTSPGSTTTFGSNSVRFLASSWSRGTLTLYGVSKLLAAPAVCWRCGVLTGRGRATSVRARGPGSLAECPPLADPVPADAAVPRAEGGQGARSGRCRSSGRASGCGCSTSPTGPRSKAPPGTLQ